MRCVSRSPTPSLWRFGMTRRRNIAMCTSLGWPGLRFGVTRPFRCLSSCVRGVAWCHAQTTWIGCSSAHISSLITWTYVLSPVREYRSTCTRTRRLATSGPLELDERGRSFSVRAASTPLKLIDLAVLRRQLRSRQIQDSYVTASNVHGAGRQ